MISIRHNQVHQQALSWYASQVRTACRKSSWRMAIYLLLAAKNVLKILIKRGWTRCLPRTFVNNQGYLSANKWRSAVGISWGKGQRRGWGDCRYGFCSSQFLLVVEICLASELHVTWLAQLVWTKVFYSANEGILANASEPRAKDVFVHECGKER